MKRITTYIAAALAMTTAACSSDEPAFNPTEPAALTVTVADSGYGPSRATDHDLTTVFAPGDSIGVFAVVDGTVYPTVNNLCLVATGTEEALTWSAADDAAIDDVPGATYFAYYPYRKILPAEINAAATDATGFFAAVTDAWQPLADQSTHEAYTASDLMTAMGTVENSALHLSMNHRMALVRITFPHMAYVFTNTPAIPDYVLAESSDITIDGVKAAVVGPEHRILVNPASKAEISGSYFWGDKKLEWRFTPSAEAGTANTYNIDRKNNREISHNLQIGDYFLSDGTLLSKDADEATVKSSDIVGIIYNIDPDRIGQAEKDALGGTVHGSVMSLLDIRKPYEFGSWSTELLDESTIGIMPALGDTPAETFKLTDKDVSGLAVAQAIAASRPEQLASGVYEMIGGAIAFGTDRDDYAQLRSRTTGWYMPAAGQWFDIARNLGGGDLSDATLSSRSVKDLLVWKGITGMLTNINAYMAKIDASLKDDLKDNRWYWTATTADDRMGYYLQITDGQGIINSYSFFAATKTSYGKCRPVLTF